MILLMLDFDGTLASIRRRPGDAGLSPGKRGLLAALARDPQISLAVISGRSLPDVAGRVGIRGIIYAGCHGLEMRGPRFRFVHPGAARLRPLLRRAAHELSRSLRGLQGIELEDKGLAVAVHYRRAGPAAEAAAKRAAADQAKLSLGKLKLFPGRKVIELRPDVNWDKGRAAELIMKRINHGRSLPVYIGDDLTDEPALAAVRGRGLGMLVESRERPKATAAAYRMGSVSQVARFLKGLSRD